MRIEVQYVCIHEKKLANSTDCVSGWVRDRVRGLHVCHRCEDSEEAGSRVSRQLHTPGDAANFSQSTHLSGTGEVKVVP